MCLDSFLHFLHFLRRTAQTTVHIDNPTGQEVVISSVLAAECAVPTVDGMVEPEPRGAAEVLKYRSTNKINFKAPKVKLRLPY